MPGAICLLSATIFGLVAFDVTPVVAEPLASPWQSVRTEGHARRERACDGDKAARREIVAGVEAGTDLYSMTSIGYMRRHCGLFREYDNAAINAKLGAAAEAGYPSAQYYWGVDMVDGTSAHIPHDPEGGAVMLDRAARAGHGKSAQKLAFWYALGTLLPRDLVKAQEYLAIAEAEGVNANTVAFTRGKIEMAAAQDGVPVPEAPEIPGATAKREKRAANAVFAQLKEQFGEGFGAETGYLEKAGVYYFLHCSATSFGKLAVFRLQKNGEAQVWSDERGCVNGIDETDLNSDGEAEIRYYTQGGGSGTYAAMVNFLHWPEGEPAPKPGLKYTTYSYSHWNGLYPKYGYEDGTHNLKVTTTGELVEGPSCKWGEYCPSWPTDAECRAAIRCPMVVEKSLYVGSDEDSYPDELRGNREWERFVQRVYEGTGFRLANKGAPEGIVSASLSPLEKVLDAAEGEQPGEVSEARKDLISDWLNQ
ncbi:hypothetical protein A3731_12360 [Roseovarius sp. HI0049]|nr:hypothetical protein A3731_12360 [Roseovarius sp. HI0049]